MNATMRLELLTMAKEAEDLARKLRVLYRAMAKISGDGNAAALAKPKRKKAEKAPETKPLPFGKPSKKTTKRVAKKAAKRVAKPRATKIAKRAQKATNERARYARTPL